MIIHICHSNLTSARQIMVTILLVTVVDFAQGLSSPVKHSSSREFELHVWKHTVNSTSDGLLNYHSHHLLELEIYRLRIHNNGRHQGFAPPSTDLSASPQQILFRGKLPSKCMKHILQQLNTTKYTKTCPEQSSETNIDWFAKHWVSFCSLRCPRLRGNIT